MNKIRQRLYTLKNRLYIEGQYLAKANFEIGRHIKYDIDYRNKKIVVSLTDEATHNRVAQTTVRSGKIVPVIDIKAKEVKEFFEKNKHIEVSVYQGQIFFTVIQPESTSKTEQTGISIPVTIFANSLGFEQLSIFDMFNLSPDEQDVKTLDSSLGEKVTNTIRMLSLFSGIGAFEKALSNQHIPFDVVNYCEIDKYASKAYSLVHNIPESLNLWDVKKVTKELVHGDVDLMTWGFPCTDLSNAGKMKGLIDEQGNATRSGLYFDGIRILQEVKPKFSIIENVKALISNRFRNEFNMMLRDLKKAGYDSYWACYNASDFGVPQNRERVFIVSVRRDVCNAHVDLTHQKRQGQTQLKDFLIKGQIEEKYYVNKAVSNNFREKVTVNKKSGIISLGQVSNNGSQAGKVYSPLGNFPTLCACTHGYALGYIMVDDRIRRVLPVECGRLMGFDDEDIYKCQEKKLSDTQIYKMLGNSIVVKVLEHIFCQLFGRQRTTLAAV